jgi:hypothetical protein
MDCEVICLVFPTFFVEKVFSILMGTYAKKPPENDYRYFRERFD